MNFIISPTFLAHSELIKLGLPQAAQLSLQFCWKVENLLGWIFVRDLFKDAPLIELVRKEKRREKEPSSQQELNLGPLEP